MIIFSIANLLLLGYFGYIVYSICVKEDVKGVVIVEGNYFKYAWSAIKKAAFAVADFFTKTVPSWFKKDKGEDNNAI